MSWLLEEETRRGMQAAYDAGKIPDAEKQEEFEAAGRGESLLTTAGASSEIRIEGVLTQRPDLMAKWFGGGNTVYGDIISALAEADADPAVEDITLAVDSPGGQFSGLFDVLAAIQNTGKPVRTVVHGMAASAAYAIASQTDSIEARNKASMVGSIGVAASFYVSESRVDIASTNAPKKRPDVRTEAGRATVREELDELHELFVDAVATGRNVTVQAVNADFGQGATLLADKALSRGMIDAISGVGRESGGDEKTEATKMDIQTLRAEEPALYAQVFEAGVSQERDRVSAHLILGEASGAMDTAVAAVTEGSEMTATLNAKYQAASMNRDAVAARQADDEGAAAADTAVAPVTVEVADTVMDLLEAEAGIEVK
jgi:ClpP class serine protease